MEVHGCEHVTGKQIIEYAGISVSSMSGPQIKGKYQNTWHHFIFFSTLLSLTTSELALVMAVVKQAP